MSGRTNKLESKDAPLGPGFYFFPIDKNGKKKKKKKGKKKKKVSIQKRRKLTQEEIEMRVLQYNQMFPKVDIGTIYACVLQYGELGISDEEEEKILKKLRKFSHREGKEQTFIRNLEEMEQNFSVNLPSEVIRRALKVTKGNVQEAYVWLIDNGYLGQVVGKKPSKNSNNSNNKKKEESFEESNEEDKDNINNYKTPTAEKVVMKTQNKRIESISNEVNSISKKNEGMEQLLKHLSHQLETIRARASGLKGIEEELEDSKTKMGEKVVLQKVKTTKYVITPLDPPSPDKENGKEKFEDDSEEDDHEENGESLFVDDSESESSDDNDNFFD